MPSLATSPGLAAPPSRPAHLFGGAGPDPDPEPDLRLTWAPPDTAGYTVLTPNATGWQQFHLDAGTDYVIQMPDTIKNGGLQLNGGRNIVIIGGGAQIGPAPENDRERRIIYFNDPADGSRIHVEGFRFANEHEQEGDGIYVNHTEAKNVTVTVQRSRFELIKGSNAGNHGDALQIYPITSKWPGEVRFDCVTMLITYQALYVPHDGVGWTRIKRSNIVCQAGETLTASALWLGDNSDDEGYERWGMKNVALDDCYLVPRSGRTLNQEVIPNTNCAVVSNRPVITGDPGSQVATWPNAQHQTITGELREGLPPGGDFCPEGVAGPGYESPGYL